MPIPQSTAPLRPSYIPWSDQRRIEVANTAAADWLNQQRGQGLVLTDSVQNAWRADLDHMLKRDTLIVGTKNQVRLRRWGGGSVLVAWPSRKVLDSFRHIMARADSVLIIEWAPDQAVTEWLTREEAQAVPLTEGSER